MAPPPAGSSASTPDGNGSGGGSRVIPTYTIDLAQPPELRYAELARDFGERMRGIRSIFDEILSLLFPAAIVRRAVRLLARKTLHRLRDEDETREIRSIAEAAGVELYLMIVFNTVLDYLLGCTSGAVRVNPPPMTPRAAAAAAKAAATNGAKTDKNSVRLMHFRTLDWGMERLRDLLVVLEFVNSSSETPDRVLARSITYAGFVGTLTAVRENMSISMNFRPNHTCSTHSLWIHQLLVLLGRRRSLPSILRAFILEGMYPPSPPQKEAPAAAPWTPAADAFTPETSTSTPPPSQSRPQSQSQSQPRRTQSRSSHHHRRSQSQGSIFTFSSSLPTAKRLSLNLKDQARRLAAMTTAPCYLVLCDGAEVAAIEKDLTVGSVRTSTDFLVHTNHDVHEAEASSDPTAIPGVSLAPNNRGPLLAFEEWLEDSTTRRDSVAKKWRRHLQRNYPAFLAASAPAPEPAPAPAPAPASAPAPVSAPARPTTPMATRSSRRKSGDSFSNLSITSSRRRLRSNRSLNENILSQSQSSILQAYDQGQSQQNGHGGDKRGLSPKSKSSATTYTTTANATATAATTATENGGDDNEENNRSKPSITLATLKRWIQADPVTNECTHFSCILDPKLGEIRWIESLDPPAIED